MATIHSAKPHSAKPTIHSVRPLVAQFMKFKESKKYPLPEIIYKEFGIEKPDTYNGVNEYLKDFERTKCLPGDSPVPEIRLPAPGGLRTLGDLTLPIEVESAPTNHDILAIPDIDMAPLCSQIPTIDESDPLHSQETIVPLVDSTESSETKIQESVYQIESSPQ